MYSLSVSEKLALSAAFDLIKDLELAENPVICLHGTPIRVDLVENSSVTYLVMFRIPHNSKSTHRVWVKLKTAAGHWYKGLTVLESTEPSHEIWRQEFSIWPVTGSLRTQSQDSPYREEYRSVEDIIEQYL